MIFEHIKLPFPPSVNHLYGQNGHFRYITPKGVAWFDEAGWELKRQVLLSPLWGGKILEGPIKICIKLYYCGRFDWDNGLKALNDIFMKMEIIKDDSQIMFGQVEKIKVKHKELRRCEVSIYDYIQKK